jgi:hypothetical protein
MRDDLEPADRRVYLMAKIEKALKLARMVDANTAEALRRLAAEYQDELKRTYAADIGLKARGRTPDASEF